MFRAVSPPIIRSSKTVECVWNLMAHGDAREGKWRGNWRLEWVASTLTLPRNVVYPALLPLMRTPRLPAVDWTDAPADLNGLVRFGERRNLVSAHVPSHFKRTIHTASGICQACLLLPLAWVSSNSRTLAVAASKLDIYPMLCVQFLSSWWWAREPPETCRALTVIILYNVVSCWLYLKKLLKNTTCRFAKYSEKGNTFFSDIRTQLFDTEWR